MLRWHGARLAMLPPSTILDSVEDGGTGEDRSGGVALDALWRGRSHPARVHAPARPGERDRKGCASRAQPLRGAPRAVLSPAHRAARRPQRAVTVTGAQTVKGHSKLRGDARALDAAARACDAVGRLFETSEPHPGVFNLLCRKLSLLDEKPAGATRAGALAFRLKLLVAAGIAPQLGACACCGGRGASRRLLRRRRGRRVQLL